MPHLLPISALLAGVGLLVLGYGLLTTLITLRGNLEGFGDGLLGLIASAYFVGFVLGTFVVPALIADDPAAMLGSAWWSAAVFSWAACAFVAGPLALFCALLHTAVLIQCDRRASRRVDRRMAP